MSLLTLRGPTVTTAVAREVVSLCVHRVAFGKEIDVSFVNSLVLWGLYGHAGRVDQALRGVKLKREECGSRRLLHSYSDESYHWEESAPFGRSLLRGLAYCQGS